MLRLNQIAALALLSLAFAGPAMSTAPARHEMTRIDAPSGAFMIDVHEVSVGQFRVFATATGLETRAEKEGGGFQYLGGWQRMPGWTWAAPYGSPARDDEPAAHVTWHEANAYCTWAGLRLPTDAEWVAAAYTEWRVSPSAPFTRGRAYPYPTGDTPDAANQIAARGHSGFNAPAALLGQGRGHLPVKSTSPGVNGLYDMGGNLWEWVDHDTRGEKRTRGGSWWYGAAQMRADAIYDKQPDFPAVYIGFRCVRAPV
jgi:sulfatase modifying factor 1